MLSSSGSKKKAQSKVASLLREKEERERLMSPGMYDSVISEDGAHFEYDFESGYLMEVPGPSLTGLSLASASGSAELNKQPSSV